MKTEHSLTFIHNIIRACMFLDSYTFDYYFVMFWHKKTFDSV